ncbi:MAG TPA: sugar ABC transporter permease [Thermotogota bacterium]|nr:sugar ABC transporter permease [Thermotogota bacterium]HPR97245.1 sugar ABC transporter permease [Thermotogota bacterium]
MISKKERHNLFVGLAFLAPALVFYLLYFVIPVPMSFFYSFFKWNGITPDKEFVGLKNWFLLFQDKVFWQSVMNNFILVIMSIIIQIPMGILLGSLVSSKIKGARIFKLLYFVPMTLSAVAIGLIWTFIYEPNFGVINTMLDTLGLSHLATGWLGDPDTAFGAVILTISWEYIPFYMILFAAAISSISKDLNEAAYIDGATETQVFFKITLPLISNTIKTSCVLVLTGSLKYFGLIFVMTEGGPSHSTELMATYMYKQSFTNFRMGYGSTIASFMFILSAVLTVVTLYVGGRKEEFKCGRKSLGSESLR